MPRYPGLSAAPQGLSSRVYTSLLSLAREHAPEVFALNVGDTYLQPAPIGRVEALSSQHHPRLYNYADVRGEPALLDAISRDLEKRGRPVPRELLQVTSGATSGLDLASRALLSPGDEVIVLAPYWPLIRGIISAAGGVPVELPFFSELRKPGFDPRAALASVITPRTAALYVNHPHNPTGALLRQEELRAIADVVAEHDLWLLSDEAYERLHFHDEPPPALWSVPGLQERSVVAHTLSKSHGMAGARIGYLHGPGQAMEAIANLQTYATYCAPRPMQQLAAQALASEQCEAWLRTAREAYARAAARTAQALGVATPESGTFLLFDTRPFLRAGESSPELLARCARAGVVLTPGAATGSTYADWARLCYTAVPPDALERALLALRRTLLG